MTQRALITGISGFVGGFLAEHLLASGDAVLGTSPDGRWMAESSPGLASSMTPIAWDLGRSDGLSDEAADAIRRVAPNVVYHLAAVSMPEDCGDEEPTDSAWAVNVEGTRRVLELAASLPSRPRVLVVSSSHVYAAVEPLAPRVSEDSPTEPQRGYGKTKLAAERVALDFAAANRTDVVVARAFQHTGPRQSPRMMLPQWARQFAAESDGPIEVHTLDAWIDLSDARDVVRAYRLLAERGRSGEVYNIGSGENRRTGDILDLLRQAAREAGVRFDRRVVETRPGRKQDPVADCSRLTSETGWRSAIRLEQTVVDTLAYWRGQFR